MSTNWVVFVAETVRTEAKHRTPLGEPTIAIEEKGQARVTFIWDLPAVLITLAVEKSEHLGPWRLTLRVKDDPESHGQRDHHTLQGAIRAIATFLLEYNVSVDERVRHPFA
jgi:hypothetical protein